MSFTDFQQGLQDANAYLDARHHVSGTRAAGSDALRVVANAEYSFTLRELLCGILSGNGIKLPNIQICLHANIQALLGIPNLQAELRDALQQLDGAFQEFMDHTTLDSILGRLNGVLAEAQNVANMINFCSAPVDPIAIPNMLENAFGSFLGAGMDLINQIGSIAPENVCACIGPNGFNTNVFNGGILGTISSNIDAINAGSLGQSVIDSIRNDIESVSSSIRNLINVENNIRGAYDLGGSQFATPDPGCNSNVGVMHNPNTGSVASNARLTATLKSLYDRLAGYPVIANNGTEYSNVFQLLLEPELLALLDSADDPNSDVSNQIPVYDYCGTIIGYTTNYVQQEPKTSDGSQPTVPNSPGYHAGGLITDTGNTTGDTSSVQNTTVEYTINSGGGSTVYIVNSLEAQLSLQTNTHDIVVRSDILTTFVRKDTATFNTGTITDYQQASVTFTTFGNNVNDLQGEGFVIKDGDGAVARVLTGQTNQIEVLNADGKGGNPLIRIANNPVLPGSGAVTIPKGSITQRPTPEAGKVRYNNDNKRYEAYYDDTEQWRSFATSNDLLNQSFSIVNIGAGAEIHKQLNISNEHELRKINGLGLITVTQNTNDITINDDLTVTNTGAGTGVFKQRSTNNLQFKSLTTTTGNITITDNADSIDISGDPRVKYTTLSTTNDQFITATFENGSQPASGKTWMFTLHALAGNTGTTRRGWKLEGMVQNDGSPSIIGSVARTDFMRDTPDVAYSTWMPNSNYTSGDIVEHDLVLYRALNNIDSSSGTGFYTSPDQNSTPPTGDWEVFYTGWNVTARVVGSDFVIQVKGELANTINWSLKLSYIEI